MFQIAQKKKARVVSIEKIIYNRRMQSGLKAFKFTSRDYSILQKVLAVRIINFKQKWLTRWKSQTRKDKVAETVIKTKKRALRHMISAFKKNYKFVMA